MLVKIFVAKYGDSGTLVITIYIKNTHVSKTLITLEETITFMRKETWDKLGLHGLWPTPTIIQMVNRSTIKLEGLFEDIVVSMESWYYPVYFMIIQPKETLGGYSSILATASLAPMDAYNG